MPDLIRYLQGGIVISFNVVQKQRQEMSGSVITFYEYDCAQVNISPTRNEIIKALIRCNYSVDDEFSHINNKNKGDKKYLDEYQIYQDYRDCAKNIVDEVMSALK